MLRLAAALFIALLLTSCRQTPVEDPRIADLQKEVKDISEQNRQFADEISELRAEIDSLKEAAAARAAEEPSPVSSTGPKIPEVSANQMKIRVRPVLADAVAKLKATTDTPRKGKQFGTRIEYHLDRAVYGLLKGDEKTPHRARVIVPFDKFLESEKSSKLLNSATTQFEFEYRKGVWVLMNYE